MINGNENEAENEKQIKKIRHEKTYAQTWTQIHACFINNTFTSNARLILAKNQANANQQPEAELLLFENYSYSSSTLSSKYSMVYSKKIRKRTSVSIFVKLLD